MARTELAARPASEAVASSLIAAQSRSKGLLSNLPARPPQSHEWEDWHWQLRHSVSSHAQLEAQLQLTDGERAGAQRAEAAGLPIGISPYYLSLASKTDSACPIRKQCVPDARESVLVEGDLVDPLGEVSHEVAPHLVQRYPDRVLMLVTDRCAVYCRFCTRSRMVGDGGGAVSMEALAPALAYLNNHPEIHDVIVSGGDPLAMATDRLVRVVAAVRAIPHIDTIRLATRVPVTLPMRITDELLQALRPYHPLFVMTHFNHPAEVTPRAKQACEQLADAGFPVMNQTVLLRGINDNATTLEALFRALVRARVRPYYLLQTDPVAGTGHLRTPLQHGIDLMAQLQGRLSGIALPKFICDTPGGLGKVQLQANSQFPVARTADGVAQSTLTTFRGEQVIYTDPPATPLNHESAQ
jgi:lysine 2,3-aminomutase